MRLFARSADRPWASTTRAGLVGTLLLGSQLASAIELDLDSTGRDTLIRPLPRTLTDMPSPTARLHQSGG